MKQLEMEITRTWSAVIRRGEEDWPDVSWHFGSQVLRPDMMTVDLTQKPGGEITVSGMRVSGGLVLKSGDVSGKVRVGEHWYRYAALPAWVRPLVDGVAGAVRAEAGQ